ncbi:NADPH-dependent FMN reductase [Wenzhouxiangella sediminis]|uniref:NAD(P)H-dependent oxidoreductase n=1 Tax=Wenzhouxiangella sediminis TaxID=1792836 RepID=A0A3E1K5V2_9GAMM|nr:NAD(P)H-dependent oxidoreductase [Wenzhouxiangella sediminis]RFF29338.1 NAD(P)H-dependent oxidoreductase [Wenzhouxiangella sediminis]
MQWIAISGSLRKDSFNTRLAHLIADRASPEVSVSVQTLHGIPLYDGDLEASSGIPAAVESLRSHIKAADGLIIVTPEYNASMPGVLKNALDWLTRPGDEMKPTFGGRPTGLVGATPGAWGTAFAQAGALINLRQLGCHLHPGYLRVSRAGDLFGDGGSVEQKLASQVDRWIESFRAFTG